MAQTQAKKKAPRKTKATTALNVAFVLDMSGSMGIIRNAAIEGANQYIHDLQKDKQAASTRLTLICFDNYYEVWFSDQPVQDVEFVGDRYQPRGGTALYDSIARTIALLDEAGRKDEKHLVVILTDGFENASVEYAIKDGGRERLAALIQAYEERGNWTFVYLGANDQNVEETAAAINIPRGNAAYYAATSASVTRTMDGVSGMTLSRKYSANASSPTAFADASLSTDFRDDTSTSNS